MLKWIATILSSIVSIGGYVITRRKQVWVWYKKWRKGNREDKVDKAITSRDGRKLRRVFDSIAKKRNKRHKAS